MSSNPRILFPALPLSVSPARAWAPGPLESVRSPYGGCGGKCVAHLHQDGFEVITRDVDAVAPINKQAGMAQQLGPCHGARGGGHVIAGRIPAAHRQHLLQTRHQAPDLAGPGMPAGPAGMDAGIPSPDRTLRVQPAGSGRISSTHPLS